MHRAPLCALPARSITRPFQPRFAHALASALVHDAYGDMCDLLLSTIHAGSATALCFSSTSTGTPATFLEERTTHAQARK
eukprot:6184308-Pleurochrysis_carterae.AAC.2